jgi:cellulose 1,4-beta-cellobiosidase
MGDTSFYGPGKTLDTSKPMTVVTQFITNDGTTTGTLSEIKRFYVQNGATYANSQSKIAGVTGNSITDNFCANQKTVFGDTNEFAVKGGLTKMSAALKNGMVLVMSIWDDHAVGMEWLDAPYPPTADPTKPGVVRGSCATGSGDPTLVESTYPGSSVTYSNIKWGPINSTFSAGTISNPGGGSSSTTKINTSTTSKAGTTTTSKPATTSASGGGTGAAHWAQCGGQGWTGATTCVSPYTCTKLNDWYFQCL